MEHSFLSSAFELPRSSFCIMISSMSQLLCFLLLLVVPLFTFAQTYSNITLGSSLTAQNENTFWASPSGDFAFGFQQIGNGGFLLAIWFNKIPERTIVWSANGNNLVQSGSRVQLTTDGQLVLSDQSGRQVWYANSASAGVSHAALLDTGNFVLASRDSVYLWESFDQPTDTILPTQIMNQGGELIASYAEANYSNGRFKFTLQIDGNLLLYSTNYPLDSNNYAYWSTQTSIGSGYQAIYNQSGNIYLIASNGSILNPVLSNGTSTQDFYQRATLDYDGVFRQYLYPKSAAASDGKWTTASFIPSNICLRIIGSTGSGACGFNSYCRLEDDGRPSCQCPPSYTFIDPNDISRGCEQNFVPQSCNGASQEADLFEFMEMDNTDWPLSDYGFFESVTMDWCKQACLTDCHCDVAIFRSNNCWKKKMPLSNGKVDTSVGGTALIKVRKDNSTATSRTRKTDQTALIVTGSALLSASFCLNIYLLLRYIRRQKQNQITVDQNQSTMRPRHFTYKELEAATGGFKEELGSGAFGTVYKGVLSGEPVAVKKLDKMVSEGEQEFRTEVSVIGGTNHKNLVQIIGFCNEGQHRLLVYEYMSNGSVANFLFGNSSRPNWYKRIQICFAIARGLYYLHEECSPQIIHCDIKPQNILLDESLTAKISDFGLAKLLKADQSRTTTAIRGTRGYVAPEWFKNMAVTVKVDVYSFGILLLEMICCRRNFEIGENEENVTVLEDLAYECYQEGKLHLLVKKDEDALEDMKMVEKLVMVATWCIQEDPSLRPTMKEVTQMLEGDVQVPTPPEPTSFVSAI